jgi:chromosomal replication initiator protein
VERAEELWNVCADMLRTQVSEATWKTWFEGIVPVATSDDELNLAVPSSLVKERIEGRYLSLVQDVVTDTVGNKVDITLDVRTRSSDYQSPNEPNGDSFFSGNGPITGGSTATMAPPQPAVISVAPAVVEQEAKVVQPAFHSW